jgi:mannose-6-phosphate isomerase-like protein (cupin superfamily)
VTAVIHPDDVEPFVDHGIAVRRMFDDRNGCAALHQVIARLPPGHVELPPLEHGEAVLYVVSGRGTIELDGEQHQLEPESGVFAAPGKRAKFENPGPDDLVIVGVVAPNGGGQLAEQSRAVVRFADQPEEEASPERSFRYLVETGTVTQFLGIVQPSKAPFHSHPYDEVGYIVEGTGLAHVDGEQIPLREGSCFHLTPGQVHSIENVGPGPMRILGLFHPSGSPASRAYQGNK